MRQTTANQVAKIEAAKKKRPVIWCYVFFVVTILVATDIFIIYDVCRRYSVPFREVVSESDILVGGVDYSVSYPGYIVTASAHFHMLLLTILLGMGLVAFLIRYFRCQDLVLRLYRSAQESHVD